SPQCGGSTNSSSRLPGPRPRSESQRCSRAAPSLVFSIYSDRSFLGAGALARRVHAFAEFSGDALPHVPMLVPFWGTVPEQEGDPVTGRYDRYARVGKDFLQMTPLADADAAVFPQSWAGVVHDEAALEQARRFSELASGA